MFYGTLRANTIHKHNYDELVQSDTAKSVQPYTVSQTQLNQEEISLQDFRNNDAIQGLQRSSTFYQQAFKGSNLKYHLIRHLLEQKKPDDIMAIRQEIEAQQKLVNEAATQSDP